MLHRALPDQFQEFGTSFVNCSLLISSVLNTCLFLYCVKNGITLTQVLEVDIQLNVNTVMWIVSGTFMASPLLPRSNKIGTRPTKSNYDSSVSVLKLPFLQDLLF